MVGIQKAGSCFGSGSFRGGLEQKSDRCLPAEEPNREGPEACPTRRPAVHSSVVPTWTCSALLPSPEEVEGFVKDPSPRAWENLVDKLLASPHYGERWGRHWLDVVRYADSSGYELADARHAQRLGAIATT